MNSDVDWAAHAQRFQQDLAKQWSQALAGLQQPGTAALPQLGFDTQKLQALQQAYVREASELWNQGLGGKPAAGDKRFGHDAWARNPVAAFSAAVYLLNARTLLGLAEATDTDSKTKARLRFAVEQWMAASAPSNFIALNAEAQQKALETKGESIARGMKNLLADLQQGHVSMTDEAGVRAPLPGGAALHQQVLHPRPAAGELAHPLPGGAGPPHFRGELAQPGCLDGEPGLGRLHR